MPSKNTVDLIDFLAETLTTPEDAAALERIRTLDRLDPVTYLRFLRQFEGSHPPDREIPLRHEPFTL